jgi:hypothetical protein
MPIIQLTRDQINMLIAAMDAMLDADASHGFNLEEQETLHRILMRAESRPRKPSIACAVTKPLNKPL